MRQIYTDTYYIAFRLFYNNKFKKEKKSKIVYIFCIKSKSTETIVKGEDGEGYWIMGNGAPQAKHLNFRGFWGICRR